MGCTRVLLSKERRVATISPARRRVQDIWPTSQYPDTIDVKMGEIRVLYIYLYNDDCKMLLLSSYTRMCKSILHMFIAYCRAIPCWYPTKCWYQQRMTQSTTMTIAAYAVNRIDIRLTVYAAIVWCAFTYRREHDTKEPYPWHCWSFNMFFGRGYPPSFNS